MLVVAKCVARAFDNDSGREYFPGLEYEIDSDSKLATLTVVPVAYNAAGKTVRYFRDHDGKITEQPTPKPPYVFQFDRNICKTDEGVVVTNNYSCKLCGEKFNTLNEIGVHAKSNHPETFQDGTEDEPVVVRPDGRKKPKTFTCHECGNVSGNLYHHRIHLKTHKTEAAPEL